MTHSPRGNVSTVETQTKDAFERAEDRFLVVANPTTRTRAALPRPGASLQRRLVRCNDRR